MQDIERRNEEGRPPLTQSEIEEGDKMMKAWNEADNQHETNKRGRSSARGSNGNRSRSPKREQAKKAALKNRNQVNADWRKQHPTHDEWKDLDPRELPDVQLSEFFEGREKTKPFITYVGGQKSDRKEVKVRVNGKFKPWDDKVSFPPHMENFKKTTMVKYTDDSTWHVVATRVAATEILEMKDLDREVEKL